MTYIHPTTSTWPYSLAQLRQDHPNVSFSVQPTAEDLAPFGVFNVAPVEPPSYDPSTHRIEEVFPENVGGEWRQRWSVIELTEEERTAWRLEATAPNYETFYTAFLNSAVYQTVLFPALLQPGSDVLGNSMTWVGFAIQDAMNGRVPLPSPGQPNSLQSAIWAFVSVAGGTLPAEGIAEIQGLMEAHGLAPFYSLTPPLP